MKERTTFKKWTAALLVLMMIFSLTACADASMNATSGSTVSTDPSTNPSTDPTDIPTDPTEPSTEPTIPETVPTDPGTDPTDDPIMEPSNSDNPVTGFEYEITPLYGAVAEGGPVDASYFNDVVFVGDSVSVKLTFYAAATGALGDAKFLTAGSLGSGNALWDVSDASVHPVYNGKKQLIEESIASMDVSKVYIMLGMNDIALYGLDGAVANLVKLIGRIKANAPDVQIVVQSMTPMTPTSNLLSSGGHNPERIHTYNTKLMETCMENDWFFLDVASVMYDGNGFLCREYCSDPDGMGIHFTNAGCAVWVDYLLTHPIQ